MKTFVYLVCTTFYLFFVVMSSDFVAIFLACVLFVCECKGLTVEQFITYTCEQVKNMCVYMQDLFFSK